MLPWNECGTSGRCGVGFRVWGSGGLGPQAYCLEIQGIGTPVQSWPHRKHVPYLEPRLPSIWS